MAQPELDTYRVDLCEEAVTHPRFRDDIGLQQEALEAIFASSATVMDARREATEVILPSVNAYIGFDPRYHRNTMAMAVGNAFIGLNRPTAVAQPLPFAGMRGIFRGATIINATRDTTSGVINPELGIAIADKDDPRKKYGLPFDNFSLNALMLVVPLSHEYDLMYNGGAYLRRQGARIRAIVNGPDFAALSEKRRVSIVETLLSNTEDELLPEDDCTVHVECTKMYETVVSRGSAEVNAYDGMPLTLRGTNVEVGLPELESYSSQTFRVDFPLSGGMPELILRTIGDKRFFRIPLDACVGLNYETEVIDVQPVNEVSAEYAQSPDMLAILGKARKRCQTIIESADFRSSTAEIQRTAFDGILEELNQRLEELAEDVTYPSAAVTCMASKYRVIRTDQIGKISYAKLPIFDQSDMPMEERTILAGDAVFASIPELDYEWKNVFKDTNSFRFSGGEPVLALHAPEKEAFYLILARDVTSLDQGAHIDR